MNPFLITNFSEMFTSEERQLETIFEMERPNTTLRLPDLNNWSLVSAIERTIHNTLIKQNQFNMKSSQEVPAPMFDVGLSSNFFQNHLSKFKTFCPVKFVENGVLADTVEDRVHAFRCLHKNKIYCMSDASSFEMFLSNFEKYSCDSKFPVDLPREVNDMIIKSADTLKEEEYDDEIANRFEYKGFCPVSLSLGVIIWGRSRFTVEYKGKLFRMISHESRIKFMQTPWNFLDYKLPSRLPIRQRDWPNLGVVEYLEESVEKVITTSVLELAKTRPLYRGLSVKESALKHLGILLKKNNKKLVQ